MKLFPQMSVLAQATWLILSLPPNKETKDEYNAGLDFQISGSPGAQTPISLHTTSLFQP